MLDALSVAVGFASWPSLVFLAAFILLTVEIAYESGFIAFMTLAVVAAFSVWMGWFSVGWAVHNWQDALLMVAAYVPVGVLWAVVKWWFYVRARARDLNDRILQARQNAKDRGRDPDVAAADVPRELPQVRDYKSDIMRWMAWWPFSFVGTLLNDPFRRMFEALYRWLGTFLQEMSDRAFAHLQLPEVPNDGSPQNPSGLAQ